MGSDCHRRLWMGVSSNPWTCGLLHLSSLAERRARGRTARLEVRGRPLWIAEVRVRGEDTAQPGVHGAQERNKYIPVSM